MVNSTRIRILLALVCLLAISGPIYRYLERNDMPVGDFFLPGTPVVRIENVAFRVEIVKTPEERQRGLSGRAKFDTADGLLFVFPKVDYHGIWMKDMLIPIDIIWISEDKRIVDIQKNVDPSTYPTIFRPSQPAKYVIETNAHFTDAFDLYPGQIVELPEEFIAN